MARGIGGSNSYRPVISPMQSSTGSIPTPASNSSGAAEAGCLLACDPRPGGEIGRRKGLKIPRPQGHDGSSPSPGTKCLHQAHPVFAFRVADRSAFLTAKRVAIFLVIAAARLARSIEIHVFRTPRVLVTGFGADAAGPHKLRPCPNAHAPVI